MNFLDWEIDLELRAEEVSLRAEVEPVVVPLPPPRPHIRWREDEPISRRHSLIVGCSFLFIGVGLICFWYWVLFH